MSDSDSHAARESDGERASQLPEGDATESLTEHLEEPDADVAEQEAPPILEPGPAERDEDRIEPADDPGYDT